MHKALALTSDHCNRLYDLLYVTEKAFRLIAKRAYLMDDVIVVVTTPPVVIGIVVWGLGHYGDRRRGWRHL